MKSPRNWVAVWACGWALLSGLSGPSQAQQIALPSGWQQLSNDDFAAAVRKLYTAYLVDRLSPAEHDAVRAEGHTLHNGPISAASDQP